MDILLLKGIFEFQTKNITIALITIWDTKSHIFNNQSLDSYEFYIIVERLTFSA